MWLFSRANCGKNGEFDKNHEVCCYKGAVGDAVNCVTKYYFLSAKHRKVRYFMINMTQFVTNNNADNTVVVNGAQFKVTDDVALKIMQLIGIGNVSQSSGVINHSTPVVTPVTPVTQSTPVEKTPYVATKDFTPKYKVEKHTGTDGTELYCISRANGWTKAEKNLINTAIKSLKGIKEIEVSAEFTRKDGTKYNGTFKAWGYNTESTAKKHLKELPTVFTVDQLNKES